MSKNRSFVIWLCEMLCQALGTTIWLVILAFVQAEPYSRNDLSLGLVAGITAFVLIEFAMTGYLLTTMLAALFVSKTRRLLYPAISCGLYLIHSEIFFVAVGNPILDKHNLPIQIGGALIAFALTIAGDRLRERRVVNVSSAVRIVG